MNNINFDDKLYNILNGNEKLLKFFINNGLDQLKNEKMLKTMGKIVTLDMALKVKGINKKSFKEKLDMFFSNEQQEADITLAEKDTIEGDIIVKGVLPCPIKVPLLEAFDNFSKEQREKGLNIGYDLRSANLGINWIEDDFKNNDFDKIADVFVSAGFELFFDKEYIGKYMNEEKFKINIEKINEDFDNEKISLKDLKNRYHIISVVPCVFLVNENNLNGRNVPLSWEKLLFSGEYDDSVAIPLGDLDMFNAIMVNIYAKWGENGIKALARIYKKSLHPAEMVKKNGNQKNNPVVNISPYFFTQMIGKNSALKVIWPQDGALVSPIFLVAKKDKKNIETIIDFFTNVETGNILSANGKFPTTIYGVDNNLDESQNFLFCGWDFIHSNNIMDILRKCENIFNSEILK
ncbi:MAG: ABC transporter substrate-binding protein [Peptoniphilaceae bacterium]|uniref:ABC transporter substrate-binding protein n=1 Tax=Parvimonas sp. TaxID=1944660 RepID=UPI0025FE88EB|nr:ABC transporter substrate-binding protein [Parvimonas sp.]MCI5996697.1 ABC transporter substrate-binding protein [Parvimonas sp.]MDD7764920.1 ABC transporter substrate-binding protein [Peptoniphilaceae bacterium]MDY3050644.1 ABC transporter substrate-binding protein [Parvimonas sp.]